MELKLGNTIVNDGQGKAKYINIQFVTVFSKEDQTSILSRDPLSSRVFQVANICFRILCRVGSSHSNFYHLSMVLPAYWIMVTCVHGHLGFY